MSERIIVENVLLDEYLLQMVQSVPAYLSHFQFHYGLMYLTGCRAEESFNRELWSENIAGGYNLNPLKGNNQRHFELEQLPIEFEKWFVKDVGYDYKMNYRRLQFHVNKVMSKYGLMIENSHRLLHLFRHNYVRRLIDVGHSLEDVRSLIGHTHIDNTRQYASAEITSLTTLNASENFSWL